MIAGVRFRELVAHADERGSLTEVLRSDWPEFGGFAQAMVTINRPGVVRAWHWHRRQTDVIVVADGEVTVALYDPRPDSPTRGRIDEFRLDGVHPGAVFVPPLVYHGYVTRGDRPAVVVNFPDRLYDPASPDEERVPADAPEIGYRWDRR